MDFKRLVGFILLSILGIKISFYLECLWKVTREGNVSSSEPTNRLKSVWKKNNSRIRDISSEDGAVI